MDITNETNHGPIKDIIMKAKIEMLIHLPFYATLMHHLRVVERDEVGTMGVNSSTLYYNEEFTRGLSREELNFVLAHEVMHLALGHPWRRGSRHHQVWNIAADYAINLALVQHIESDNLRRMKAPEDICLSRDFEGMPAEEIYDIIMKSAEEARGNSKDGQGGDGDSDGLGGEYLDGKETLDNHSPWADVKNEDGAVSEEEWKARTVGAAKVAGNVPANIKRMVGDLLNPQKDWKELIAETVAVTYNDYSFSPPDRRFTDLILPDFNEPDYAANNVLVWVDTSGSVGEDEFKLFISEIVGAIEQFGGRMDGWIGSFDHVCHPPVPFTTVEDCKDATYSGGGGTSFVNVFRATQELQEEMEIATMIIFTDGYAEFPENNPFDFDVVWIMTSEIEPPFGKHARLEI